jgi:hypothetical protein
MTVISMETYLEDPRVLPLEDLEELEIVDLRNPDEKEIRSDYDVTMDNYRLYKTRRGRICEYPGCETKVRYTREFPFCAQHETSEFASCGMEAASREGWQSYPTLPGLRAARARAKVTQARVDEALGHHRTWTDRAERRLFGVSHEDRGKLAKLLSVSEAELLEGGA